MKHLIGSGKASSLSIAIGKGLMRGIKSTRAVTIVQWRQGLSSPPHRLLECTALTLGQDWPSTAKHTGVGVHRLPTSVPTSRRFCRVVTEDISFGSGTVLESHAPSFWRLPGRQERYQSDLCWNEEDRPAWRDSQILRSYRQRMAKF